jgi:hypothetical protein
LTKYYKGDETKDNEMSGKCGTLGIDEEFIQNEVRKPAG